MLARRAAAEVPAGDDDLVLRLQLAVVYEARGVERIRQADHGKRAELLVLLRDRRDEREVLRGDDLVGVDVVADDVDGAGDGFHGLSGET